MVVFWEVWTAAGVKAFRISKGNFRYYADM